MLRKGDVVGVLAESGDWRYVRSGGEAYSHIGWVHGAYLLPLEQANPYSINKGRLLKGGVPVRYVPTPNTGGELTSRRFLVMHYTAGNSAEESIQWLRRPEAKGSAHLVIGKDGSVTQMVSFDRIAWHAGKSSWKGVAGLNSHSIGIELDNLGRVPTLRPGVLRLRHKNDTAPAFWDPYPFVQVQVAKDVARALVTAYGIREIVGHDDIAPGRKSDPGPAFPMEQFRRDVLGIPPV